MSSTANAVAAGGRGRTKQGASKPTSMKPSTTAGKVSVCWRPLRRKFSRTPPSRSSRATTAPTSRSTARSTPTAAASTAASIATHARAIAISGIRRGSISKPNSTPSPTRRAVGKELAKPGYKPQTIALGANTDPYQPIERERRITRSILEVLDANEPSRRHHHQIGAGCARHRHSAADGREGLAKVAVSITSLDRSVARAMEPRAATPPRRLDTVRR